jgi:hypothetical protein
VVAITPTEWPFLKRMSWRPIPYVLAGAIVLVLGSGNAVDGAAPNRGAALCELLATRGLLCSGAPVWLSGPSGIHGAMKDGAKALVRARTSGEPLDLYLVDARLSPEGVLLDAGSAYDLTRTSQADEGPPIVRGSRVAYTTTLDGSVTAIHTIDLNGPPSKSYEDFTKTQRLQTELTNLQQLGLPHGVVHDAFVLDPIAKSVTLAWLSDDAVEARSDGRRIVIDAARAIPIEGAGWVRPVPEEKARPGGLAPWAVDRVRAMAWFGDVRMQWLKAIVFTALDSVLRARASVVDTSASEIENDLGGVNTGAASATPAEPDPDTGWPPAPLKPILSPPLPGEGQWITLDHDPFITKIPGLHAPFVTTFVRTDKERKDTRVYVTLWDPREVSLHMQAGTVEPVSATGEGGPGMIPRAPEVMKRVVAGFNGGFQAMHGEYGMQADGILYLPPKPYAATVLELRDGTTAFGAWPASQTVPDEVLSFRQNLTAIVEGGKYNPWGRYWWGGTPPGWQDNIHTTRSGICLTQDKFVGYFYGNDIAADALGAGMLAAHCSFGVHLDMNPGLAGFEFYDIEPSATWKPLGRPLQADWEYEGTVRDLPDLHVRARRMTRGMVEVNFPQYIHREARDFFYLTARAMVPGSDVEPGPRGFGGYPPEGGAASTGPPEEGVFRVKGLPQHGFPYAIATTTVRPDASHPEIRVRVLRVDPRTVVPAASAGTTIDTPTIVSFFGAVPNPQAEGTGVWLVNDSFITSAVPVPGGTRIAGGSPLGRSLGHGGSGAGARAAIGIQDEDGLLDWVELEPDAKPDATSAAAMDALLARLGCGARLLVGADARAVLGSGQDLSGTPITLPATPSTRLVRGHPSSARAYFESTPIVPPAVWQPLQAQRVRYFPKPPKADAGAPVPLPAPSPLHPTP